MRDQMIGLSYALLITGLLLTPLEYLILDSTTFWRVSPYLFGPIILGVAGLYWFKLKHQPASVITESAIEQESDSDL